MRLKTDLLRQLQLQRVASPRRTMSRAADICKGAKGEELSRGGDEGGLAACSLGKRNDNRNRFCLSCGHVALPSQVDPFTALRVVC